MKLIAQQEFPFPAAWRDRLTSTSRLRDTLLERCPPVFHLAKDFTARNLPLPRFQILKDVCKVFVSSTAQVDYHQMVPRHLRSKINCLRDRVRGL